MRSVISLVGGGAAAVLKGMPTSLKMSLLLGVGLVGGAELNKELNESWRSSRIFEGQAAQSESQSNPDVVKTLVDLKAGKPTPAATATIAVTYAKTEAEARERGAMADAASASEQELLAKQAKKLKLTTAEAIQLETLKKVRSEAESAAAASTAARAQALADRQAAELNSRLLESIQRNNGDILYTFYDMFIPKGTLGKK
jgi:hypothetical protein